MVRRIVLLALVGLSLVVSLPSGPAQAGGPSAQGWRTVAQLGPPQGDTYESDFVATGPDDAWSTWSDCGPCGGLHPVTGYWLERWNGRAWHRVALPVAVASRMHDAVALTASSRNDAWLIFGTGGKVAHWNGARWSLITVPAWVVHFNLSGDTDVAAADFGPADLWVFSLGQDNFSPATYYGAHYDGHHWIKMPLPGIPGVVQALGPNDSWAIMTPDSLKGGPFLTHWNGRSWARLAIPAAEHVPPHHTGSVGDLLALGSKDLWLQQDYRQGQTGPERTASLLHWNGTKWVRIKYGYSTDEVQFMASDGHGGLWLSDVGPGKQQLRYLVHDANGRWTRQPVPAPAGMAVQQLLTLTNIAGTTSMWATGGIFPVHSTTIVIGAIFKYGR
jgi:hypothetical protein